MPYQIPDGAFKAWSDGTMSDEHRALLQKDIESGEATHPALSLQSPQQEQSKPSESYTVPEGAAIAYMNGTMTPEHRTMLEADIQSGKALMPSVTQQTQDNRGMIEKGFDAVTSLPGAIYEGVTGAQRTTPEIEAVADWNRLPEMRFFQNESWWPNFKAGGVTASTVFTDPEETAQIIRANFPDLPARQDAKGNWIFTSKIDGKDYGIKPGFGWSDVPRVVTGALMMNPAGKASTMAGRAFLTGATEVGVQSGEKFMGGEFNPENVALATGLSPVAELIPKGASMLKNRIKGAPAVFSDTVETAAKNVPENAPLVGVVKEAPVEQGAAKPIKGYHSTNKDFDNFELSKTENGRELGDGIYFSSEPQTKYGKNIKEAYLDIKNPWSKDSKKINRKEADALNNSVKDPSMRVDSEKLFSTKEEARKFVDEARADGIDGISVTKEGNSIKVKYVSRGFHEGQTRSSVQRALNYEYGPSYIEILKDIGYDGVISQDGKQMVVFDPSQIKQIPKQAAQDVAEQIPIEQAAQAIPDQSVSDVAKLIRKATTSNKAKKELAEVMDKNPDLVADAELLGMEVPADMVSNNLAARRVAGITRSVAGSKAETDFWANIQKNVDKADEALNDLGAIYSEGGVSVGAASSKIRNTLKNTRKNLNDQASKIYDEIEAVVPKRTVVKLNNLLETLDESVLDAGDRGVKDLSPQELRLYKILRGDDMTEELNDVTYKKLMTEKRLIGQALSRKESPYGGMDEKELSILYGALSQDQFDNIARIGESIGDAGLGDKLKKANAIYAQERELGKKIIKAFGDEDTGSIGQKLVSMITSSKTDSKQFNKMMDLIPEDLKKETILTSLGAATRSNLGQTKGRFGFSEFNKIYGQMKSNPEVFDQVKAIMKDDIRKLNALHNMSKRFTEARALVVQTGKPIEKGILSAETFAEKVLASTMGKAAVTGTVAGATGGFGAMGVPYLTSMVKGGGEKAFAAAGDLMNSKELKDLIVETMAKGQASNQTVKKLAMSDRFNKFWNYAKRENPKVGFWKEVGNATIDKEAWIKSSLMIDKGTEEEK